MIIATAPTATASTTTAAATKPKSNIKLATINATTNTTNNGPNAKSTTIKPNEHGQPDGKSNG